MKKRILSLSVILLLLLSLSACFDNEAQQQAALGQEYLGVYTQAVQEKSAQSNITLYIEATKTVTVGNTTNVQEIQETLSYAGLGTDAVLAKRTSATTVDKHILQLTETFAENVSYLTIGESGFCAATGTDAFIQRNFPVILLDSSLYSKFTATQTDLATTLHFSEPTASEAWLQDKNIQMESASGTAVFDSNDRLISSTYEITYRYGSCLVNYSVQMNWPAVKEIQKPADTGFYTQISDLRIPVMLETAALQLIAAPNVTGGIKESILSQAGGVIWNASSAVDVYTDEDDPLAKTAQTLSMTDYTTNTTDSYRLVQKYVDGKFSVSENGGQFQEADGVTSAVVRNHCMEMMMPGILSADHLSSGTITDLGSIYYIELVPTKEFGEQVCQSANQTLYNNPSLLTDMASKETVNELSAYIGIDKFTGFPTAGGYSYQAVHTIGGTGYILQSQADHSYYLPSLSAYEEITEKEPPVEKDVASPTPLFYKVTGNNGETMWLLGTIHVGDARTTKLPQEIYDALNSSDALALEFNAEKFEKDISTNADLQKQLLKHYLYADGSSAEKHIDSQIYKKAQMLMKASGRYDSTVALMKAVFWENEITNFYLQQGFGLTSDYGVDNQLAKLAKAEKIEILEVESGMAQMAMLSGFSDKLQSLLLEDTLSISGDVHYSSSAALFELWCQGDEETLKAAVNDDSHMVNTEDKPYWDEYNKAMMTDRNAGMLKVAKDYLSSGDTVFYAVGLAHLLSEDGLVATLREAGYQVEQVTYE